MENNEIIMNEEVVDDVMEVVAEAPEVDWGKIGFGALALCAIAALGYKGYRIWKDKKTKEQKVYTDTVVDNVEVAKHDFLDNQDEE